MKKILNNKYFQIGLVALFVILICITFSFCLLHIKTIIGFFGRVINILMPLIYGLILAYIMHPLVNLFDKKVFNKISKDSSRRNLSIFCSIVIIVGIIVSLISFIIPQLLLSIQSIIVNAPVYFKDFGDWLMSIVSNSEVEDSIMNNFSSISEYLTKSLNDVVLPFANSAISSLSSGIIGFLSFIFNFAIGFVFAVYILANTKRFAGGIRKFLYSIFNIDNVNSVLDEIKHINHIFGQFMIGKMCDSGIVGLCTLAFLLIFGYPYPLLIAVIICLTDLIPYFGPYIGSIPSALLICLVDPIKALTFILFMIILQQIDANFITPRIQRQATGLPSFWVLFAITLFGGLFGLVGLLIAVPCFTIIYELCIEFTNNRLTKKEMPLEIEFYEKRTDGIDKKKLKQKMKKEA